MALKYWGGEGWVEVSGKASWGTLLDKPSTFPPSTHTHAIADVTGLQVALNAKGTSNFDGKYTSLTNVPTSFTPTTHDHTTAQVTGLDGLLNSKANTSHTHTIADVANLESAITNATFDKKYSSLTGVPSTFAPSPHTHAIADTTGLQAELNAKALSSHTHTIANVTGLQTALDAATAAGFDGKYSSLTGVPATFAPSAHTHTIANVTGLQTALDNVVVDLPDNLVTSIPSSSTRPAAIGKGVWYGPTEPADAQDYDIWINEEAPGSSTWRPTLLSGQGPPPPSIPGAMPGDWWIDESTMNLYKITGV